MAKFLCVLLTCIIIRFVFSLRSSEHFEQWGDQIPDNCINRSTIICSRSKYRTIDGSCNNLRNPTLGMSFTSFRRLLPPNYGDKVSSMPLSKSGKPLPSARLLSSEAFGRKPIPDPKYTLLNMQWGQLLTHDTTMRLPPASLPFSILKELTESIMMLLPPGGFSYKTNTLKLSRTITLFTCLFSTTVSNERNKQFEYKYKKSQDCCSASGRYEKRDSLPICFAVPVPKNDPHFRNFDCINFDRSATDTDAGCRGTAYSIPTEQLNGVTHYIDMSFVYGNNKTVANVLRKYRKGLLKTEDQKSKWPPRAMNPMTSCDLGPPGGICYEFGDIRGNQNPGLTTLQIIFLREHNRIANELAKLNECWSDETLFQEARRINIAQFQYITYYEWLGNFYGSDRLLENGLIFDTKPDDYVNDYDPYVDPRGIQAFSHAAFRHFHNQVVGRLELYNEQRKLTNESYRLTDYIDNPVLLKGKCKYNSFVRGLATQAADLTDSNFDIEISDNFKLPAAFATQDLRMVDIQRSRDHGLRSYNDYRAFCGLKRAKRWSDFSDYISHENIGKLRKIYESHEDVDLVVGGGLERQEPDSLVGPTFLCISLIQMKNYRIGDRYFFENEMQPYPFKKEQLAEIRKASAARILCDNSNVEFMQPQAFRRISKSNRLKLCSEIPKMNLSLWYDQKSCGSNESKGFLYGIYRKLKSRFENH